MSTLFSRKILLGIVTLLLLVALPITIYLVRQQQIIRSRATGSAPATLTPSSGDQQKGSQFNAAISLDAGTNHLSSAEIKFTYNKNILKVVDFTPAANLTAEIKDLGTDIGTNKQFHFLGTVPSSASVTGANVSIGAIKFEALNTGTANLVFDNRITVSEQNVFIPAAIAPVSFRVVESGGGGTGGAQTGSASLSLSPSTIQKQKGLSFSVDLFLNNPGGLDIAYFETKINFTGSVVKILNFNPSGPMVEFFKDSTPNASGTFRYIATTPGTVSGSAASIKVGTIVFEASEIGISPVTFSDTKVSASGQEQFLTISGNVEGSYQVVGPPPAAPTCPKFEIPSLTRTGTNGSGGPIYTAPSLGSNNLVDLVFTPVSATASFIITSQPAGIPPLTITETNTGAGIVRTTNIPANASTAVDNTYTINAKITSGVQQVDCLPMQIVVPKPPTPTPSPTPTPAVDNSSCEGVQVLGPNLQAASRVVTGNPYVIRVKMKNSGDKIWDKDLYKLAPTQATKDSWNISDKFVRDSREKESVSKNGTTTFDINVNAPLLSGVNPENKPLSFKMFNGSSLFGPSCEVPDGVTVNPPNITTSCFFVSENSPIPATLSTCDQGPLDSYNSANNTSIKKLSYTSHPMNIAHTLSGTAGVKTIFTRFISNLGAIQDSQKSITLSPSPQISGVLCSYSPTGDGTVITINGSNFGDSQGKGKVRVGNKDADQILEWGSSKVVAKVSDKLTAKTDLKLTSDKNQESNIASCTLNVTTMEFTARQACRESGFSASGVDIKIFEKSSLSDPKIPLHRQRAALDETGRVTGLSAVLEAGKEYSVIVKAPKSTAKSFEFKALSGTTVLEDILSLPTGDIAPSAVPDGKINAVDVSELKRQWSLVTDVTRSGDFNNDSRVNSVDYACLRNNFGSEDQSFSKPAISTSPSPAPAGAPSATPSPSPSPSLPPSLSPSPSSTASAQPTTSPSPSPSSSASSFRISLDPNFSTILKSGDLVGTQTIVDLNLPPTTGKYSVYVQFLENGSWGPTPPQTASITVI